MSWSSIKNDWDAMKIHEVQNLESINWHTQLFQCKMSTKARVRTQFSKPNSMTFHDFSITFVTLFLCVFKWYLHLQTGSSLIRFFFEENVRYPVWICGDPISLILGTRFSDFRGPVIIFSDSRDPIRVPKTP